VSFFKTIKTISPAITLVFIFLSGSCNKKCKSLESTNSGSIVASYDFKDCYVYATFDSTITITTDSAFTAYKAKQFINCSPSSLEAVDFNKNMIVGYKIKVNACNVGFHRKIEIDTTKKEYRYTVETELCTGCGTELTGTNFVVAPQIPAGYSLLFSNKKR
jgi:NAD-dependent dihydropyrimidine dehydrogenase PreA subunit